jgi:hypothetical protein
VPRIVRPIEFRPQPWKNGGGVTHEIVRWPDAEAYDVRVSLADDPTSMPLRPGSCDVVPQFARTVFMGLARPC